jgi:hypothetical protein
MVERRYTGDGCMGYLDISKRYMTKLRSVKRNLLSLSRTKDLLMTIEQLQSDALNQLS